MDEREMIANRDTYLQKLLNRRGNGSVKIITGIRRCGKSFLLFNLFRNRLISDGVPESNIISVALDDYRQKHLRDPDALFEFIESKVCQGTTYILIDEIQMVEGFVDVVNGLMHIPGADIYITGSNSRFLSSDVVTEFRGRGDEVRVFPLTFSEFQEATGLQDGDAWKRYMIYGGMPELLNRGTDEQIRGYLTDLVRLTYVRDVSERYRIIRQDLMDSILETLCSSCGSLVSLKKITDTVCTVAGSDATQITVDRYLRILEDAFLFERSKRYDIKGRKYIGASMKFYPADVGISNACLNFRQKEPTRAMECIIYNELRFRGLSVDVGAVDARVMEDGRQVLKHYEIDFVVNEFDRRWYIQSAYDISDPGKEEVEIRPFGRIDDSFRRMLIVGGDMDPYMDKNGVIRVGIIRFLKDPEILNY